MIKVYAAKTDALEKEVYFKEVLEKIDPKRKAKIENYAYLPDQRRSLAAELLCQKAYVEFCEQLGERQAGKAAIIAYGEEGKPYCVNLPQFHFNLSHSGDYVVCAVSTREVGIDIQKQKPYQMKIAERFFGQGEVKRLQEAVEAERERLFYEIWTLKESYMKYTGNGMKQEMNSYFEDTESGQMIDKGMKTKAYSRHYHEIEGYAVTVCGEEKEFQEIIFESLAPQRG